MKIKCHIRKFWASGFHYIEVLAKEKKRISWKKEIEKKDKYYKKKVCNPDATTGGSEHWF